MYKYSYFYPHRYLCEFAHSFIPNPLSYTIRYLYRHTLDMRYNNFIAKALSLSSLLGLVTAQACTTTTVNAALPTTPVALESYSYCGKKYSLP